MSDAKKGAWKEVLSDLSTRFDIYGDKDEYMFNHGWDAALKEAKNILKVHHEKCSVLEKELQRMEGKNEIL